MIRKLFPATSTSPAEYESTNPGQCVVCGKEHDLDVGQDFVEIDEQVVCLGCKAQYVTDKANRRFVQFLRDHNIVEKIHALRAELQPRAVSAVYNELEPAAQFPNGEFVDTNEVNEVMGTLEYMQYEAATGTLESYQKAVDATLLALRNRGVC
jgi:hypothetical protein